MNQPYLIQRAKFENRPEKKGIDQLLSFDYMGSSEFEWGALPKALKRVRESPSDYVQFQYSFEKYPTKTVTVFCKKEQRDLVGDILEQLSEGKIYLKEYCDLSGWVNPNNEHSFISNENDFWWDIDNDWFFWKMNPDFDTKFKSALWP